MRSPGKEFFLMGKCALSMAQRKNEAHDISDTTTCAKHIQ